ncbi:VOC family protein [Actinoplanes teichomyceticus]|uniref:VOC family protein n=1 Tax=Actinoplanes teichomyceticus TaxID=1867 RepID=UPI0021CC71F0|nr:VOC family protein [Actinoplanes teichomyceticus]
MANQTGRPIAPARKLVAAVMGTLGVFVIVYGLGLSSWPVAIFGLVVVAIAVALAMVSNVRRGGRATVAGSAEVVDITAPPAAGAYGRAEIQAIVVAPGLGTFDRLIREGRVPLAKWPAIGATVPITVDVDDTRRVRVNWKDAPLRDDSGATPQSMLPDLGPDPDEEADDDVLGAVAPGPWEGRANDYETTSAYLDSRVPAPVGVRETPNGTIIEGQLVGSDEQVTPLPRRAGSGPRPGGFDTAATDPIGFDPIGPDPVPPGPGRAPAPGSPAPAAANAPSGRTGATSGPADAASGATDVASGPGDVASGPADVADDVTASRSAGYPAADTADQAGAAGTPAPGSLLAEPPPATGSPGSTPGTAPGSSPGGSPVASSGGYPAGYKERDPAPARTATDRPGSGASSEAWASASYPPPPGPSTTGYPGSGVSDYPPPPGPAATALEPDDYPPPPGPATSRQTPSDDFDYPPPPGPAMPDQPSRPVPGTPAEAATPDQPSASGRIVGTPSGPASTGYAAPPESDGPGYTRPDPDGPGYTRPDPDGPGYTRPEAAPASGAPSGPATARYATSPGPATTDRPSVPGSSAGAAFAAGMAAGAAVSAVRTVTGRPPGTRPSPRPRAGTATAEPRATAPDRAAASSGRPPMQRTSAESGADTDPLIDVPLDDPAPPGTAPATVADPETTRPAAFPATAAEAAPDRSATAPAAPSAEPTPPAAFPATAHPDQPATTPTADTGTNRPAAFPATARPDRPATAPGTDHPAAFPATTAGSTADRSPAPVADTAPAAFPASAVTVADQPAAGPDPADRPDPGADATGRATGTPEAEAPAAATGQEPSPTLSGRTRFIMQPTESDEPAPTAPAATTSLPGTEPPASPVPHSGGRDDPDLRPMSFPAAEHPSASAAEHPADARPAARPEPTPADARPAARPEPAPADARPEPTPADSRAPRTPEAIRSTTPIVPVPLTQPPAAPAPDRPFPTAPPPATGRPLLPADDIDIPLDENPDTPPEATPAAVRGMAAGVVAPPVEDPAPRTPTGPPRNDRITGDPEPAGAPATTEPEPVPDDRPAPGRPTSRPTGSPWGDFSGRGEPDDRAAEVITAYPSARPGPAGAIHGVGITILVTDLARSIVFYRDTLGFYEIDTGDESSVLASGDTRVVLRTVPNLAAEADRLVYLNLEVGDIEAVHQELQAKGVEFVHPPRPVNRGDKLELWSATFRDPDNHNIAITQWRAVRPGA